MDFTKTIAALFETVPEVRCEVVGGRQVWSVHHAGQVRRVRGGRRSAEIYAVAVVEAGVSEPES